MKSEAYLTVEIFWYTTRYNQVTEHSQRIALNLSDRNALLLAERYDMDTTTDKRVVSVQGREIMDAMFRLDGSDVKGLDMAAEALATQEFAPIEPLMELKLREILDEVKDECVSKPLAIQKGSIGKLFYNLHRRLLSEEYNGAGNGWVEIDPEYNYITGMSYSTNPKIVERKQNVEMHPAAGARIQCHPDTQIKYIANFSCTQACMF